MEPRAIQRNTRLVRKMMTKIVLTNLEMNLTKRAAANIAENMARSGVTTIESAPHGRTQNWPSRKALLPLISVL
jgi:hypothetical protein